MRFETSEGPLFLDMSCVCALLELRTGVVAVHLLNGACFFVRADFEDVSAAWSTSRGFDGPARLPAPARVRHVTPRRIVRQVEEARE